MLVEKVIGNLNDDQFKNKNVDYVDIEWHEALRKVDDMQQSQMSKVTGGMNIPGLF